MSAEPRPTDSQDELVTQLVAYLDGELPPPERREVEQRLAQDEHYRRTLRQLQHSWDLLDELPKAETNDAFTQTTLDMVAVNVKQDVEQTTAVQVNRRRTAQWLGLGGAVAACLAGYLFVSALAGREDRQLLRDLPLVQNLDEYRYAESVEFLRMLEKEGIFVEAAIDNELQ
jgi:anti-sigma factor RsiW